MHRTGILKQLKGDLAVDDRGIVRFVNDFNFAKVKRFYQVENHSTETIRAFHGHLKEAKYAFVSSGAILLCVVPLDSVTKPDPATPVTRLVLSAAKPQVVYIPPGHANGFKAVAAHTIVQFFSTSSLEASLEDDYRFPYDYWGKAIWEVIPR